MSKNTAMNIVLLPAHCPKTYQINDSHTINHLIKVLKVSLGDRIKVGIEHGNLGTAMVSDLSSQSATLSDITCLTPPPPKLPLTVILALPRPKVLRRLILDMTAMGVASLYLVNSYRTEKSYWQTPFLQQIDSYIKEGLQQACDTVPMQVFLKTRLKPFVEDELPELIHNKQAIIAHPYANQHFTHIWQTNREHVLIIGAEGGWIDYEVNLFEKIGCQSAHLGPRVLRTENAVSVLGGYALLDATYINQQINS